MNLNLDAQFFLQLAAQAFLKAFLRLPFATGEFPKTAQMSVGMALGDEELAVAKNQASSDLDGGTRNYQ